MFGLSAPWLMHDGEVVPTVTVLSHSEQLDRLEVSCPEATAAALVAGDPCFDRLLASRPLRETYRRALGAEPGQQVVVVSSTWGESGLLGEDPTLPLRLAEALPLDNYRIVVALHPNIWQAHTPWQTRRWLADCARCGVVVLPPEEGWRAAVSAADITIGDHGSVTFYAAALGNAVLLAAAPEDTVDPDSPIARLLSAAERLDRSRDLRSQIDRTIRSHTEDRYAPITAMTTSEPGRSARLLRSEVYTRLAMDEPLVPADPQAVPVPDVALPMPSTQFVCVSLVDGPAEVLRADVTRHAADAVRAPAELPADAVVVASTDEPARSWLELAEILVHNGPISDVASWAARSLDALPGCLLATARDHEGRWLVASADTLVRFTGPTDLGAVCAAVVHAWLRTGNSARELPASVRLQLGARDVHAGIRTITATT